MKYSDKHLSINADTIPFYDVDRPTPALIELFNPPKNQLAVQSQALIIRVNSILHELDRNLSFGIADVKLHSIMPILIYSRKPSHTDSYFSLSNRLVIQDHALARDLLLSSKVLFFTEQRKLIDSVFSTDNFVYMIFNIKDEEAIYTAVDKLAERRGALTIHNPDYKNTTMLKKYCVDRGMHLVENVDGSADLFRF